MRPSDFLSFHPAVAALLAAALTPALKAALLTPLTFSGTHPIEDPASTPIAIRAGDLNGDGNQDIAYFEGNQSNLQIRYNLGDGLFGDPIQVANAQGGVALDLADVNGDGHLDILAGFSFNPRRLVWFQNNGDGTFGIEQLLSDTIGQMATVMFADLNGDDRPDALVSSPARSAIVWFENLGGFFGPEIRLDSNQSQVAGVDVGDIDGDGNLDIVLAARGSDEVYWFRNQGAAVFGEGAIITDQTIEAYNVTTGDLDGDGLLDVISTSINDDKLAWYRNLGDGTFGEQQIISRAFDQAISSSVADLDGDGDLDVLAGSGDQYSSGKVSWFENDGLGNFGPQNILLDGRGAIQEVIPVDLDNDSDQDLLFVGRWDNFIAWIENLRDPVPYIDFFRSDKRIIEAGEQVTLEWQISGADSVNVEPGTISPGSTSLIVSPTETTTYRLEASNSAGGIEAEITIRVEGLPIINSFRADPFTVELGAPFALTWDIEEAATIEIDQGIGPVTGDHFDIQSRSEALTLISQGAEWQYLDIGSNLDSQPWTDLDFDDSAWKSGRAKLGYGNDGEVTVVGFGPSSNNKFITTYFRREFEIEDATNLNSLVLKLLRDDGAVVYLNGKQVASSNMPDIVNFSTLALTALGDPEESTFYEIPLDASDLQNGTNVIAVELHQADRSSSDLGFDLELTAENEPSMITYTITATNQYGSSTAQATVNFQPSLFSDQWTRIDDFGGDTGTIAVEDFDGDGFGDVLVGFNHGNINDTVIWYRNNGDRTFSSRKVIAGFDARGVHWVGTADMNGDGLPDVLSSSRDKLAWYRNRGNGTIGSQRTLPIVGEPAGEHTIVIGDFDGDGDNDVAHAVVMDDDSERIQWYQNNGSGSFNSPRVIYTGGKDIEALSVADLNGDGIDDIAFVDSDEDKASWLQGNANAEFGDEQIFTTNVQLARGLELGDFDGDGHVDAIVVGWQPQELVLFTNDGFGGFTRTSSFAYAAQTHTLRANDIDLDGDLDLLYTDVAGDRVVLRENDGTGFLSAAKTLYDGSAESIRALAIADLDGDFDAEILFGSRRSSMVDFLDNLLDPEPIIHSFSGTLDVENLRAVLEWDVVAAGEISIDQGIGVVTGNSISVPLTATTTFQLTAQNTRGTTTSKITVLLDIDADGLPDDWEELHFGNLDQGPDDDPDGDLLTNSGELAIGTSPNDDDSDDDGLDDREENVTYGTDPLNADSDQDGFTDGEETQGNTDPLSPLDFPATDLMDGLIFYTKLEAQLFDEINLVNGVINGRNVLPTSNGQIGDAVDFNIPTDADQNITFTPTEVPTGAWSASFWFKPTALALRGTIIATNWQGNSFEARAERGRLQLTSRWAGVEFSLESTSFLTPNQWHHVGVSRTQDGLLTAYLDGEDGRFRHVDFPPTVDVGGEPSVLLGGDLGRQHPFSGCVDDVAIWGQTIEADKFQSIFSNGGVGTALDSINDRSSAPRITAQPQGGAFLAGESTTLSIMFEGTVPVQIQWLRDDVNIPGENSPTLTLDPLEINDSGKYSAVVSNLLGQTRSVEVFVTVANSTPQEIGDFEVQSDNANRPGGDIVIEGDYMFVSSPSDGRGAVHIYLRDSNSSSGWREIQKLQALSLPGGASQNYGYSLAAHGDTLVVGTYSTNYAHIYERSGPEAWGLVQTISQGGSTGTGFSRSLDLDERTLVIGADQANESLTDTGAVFVYEKNASSGDWEETDMLTAGGEHDRLGSKVAVSGDTIVASALGYDTPPGGTNSGGAFIFQRANDSPGSPWTLVRQLLPNGIEAFDEFGISLDIDNNTVVVGAWQAAFGLYNTGAVFVFDRNAGGSNRWQQTARILHRGRLNWDLFGADVLLRGDRLFASYVNDSLSNERNGAVFIYDRNGAGNGAWEEIAEITESPRNGGRGFGTAIDVHGTELAVSAKKETSSSDVRSKVYVFDIPPAGNSAPVFSAGDPGIAIPGELFTYEFSTTEPDGEPVTIGAAVLPGWLRLADRGDGTALLAGTPSTDDFGTHLVRILASDGLVEGTSVLEFNLEVVNTPPIVIGFAPLEVDEDSSDVSIDLFTGFSDAEYPDSELRFQIVSEIPETLLERISINPADGMLNIGFVPDANGQAEIEIRATDPGDLSSYTKIAITVLPVNDPPGSSPATPITADAGASPESVATSGLFTDIDAGDVLTFSIVGNTDPTIFQSVDIDAQSGLLQIIFADYVDGESILTIRATDTGGLFADSELSVTLPPIPKPQITPGTSMTLNRLTGLYEQQVTITNNSGRTMAAFQLAISNLNEGVSVYNSSGTNSSGDYLVDHRSIILPGESVTTNIDYFSTLRATPGDPIFDADPKLPTPNVTPPGRTFEVDRIETLPGGVLIEFPAEPGKSYAIQYAHDTTWFTSPMVVRAAGSRIQWIDSGSPKTPSPPSSVTRRFYRVIELSDADESADR